MQRVAVWERTAFGYFEQAWQRASFCHGFFAIYLVVGLALPGQYGSGVDARVERKSSLITYAYVNETLFDRTPAPQFKKLANLHDYKDKWYGMAMQIPMVVIEDLYDFKLNDHDVFLMRHYITFLYCFAGYLCFYFMLRRIFPANSWIPLIGVACIALYPRFFPLQFADVKNLVFNALVMASCYCMVLAVEKKRLGYVVLFGCVAALATNQRVMGVLYFAVLLGFFILTDLATRFSKTAFLRETAQYRIGKYPLLILSFFVFWTLITPLAWGDPIHTFIGTFNSFSDFYGWDGRMVFMGERISRAEMPWYYLPVWMCITIPISVLLLFLLGHVRYAIDISRSGNRLFGVLQDQKWLTCHLFLFWAIFFNIVLRQGAIYLAWHHVYFIFVSMVVVALFGLDYLLRNVSARTVYALVGAYFVAQCSWIVFHHPHQNVYFNVVGAQFADQFDRDEERLVTLQLSEWILAQEEGQVSIVGPDGKRIDNFMLSNHDQKRIQKERPAQYIVEYYRNVVGNDVHHEGYEEVYTIWMDRFKIGSVYRRDGSG